MFGRISARWFLIAVCGVLLAFDRPAKSQAADLLVADRLSDQVYRYDSAGNFLGVVIVADADNDGINDPTGLALSPDQTKMYVASSQNNRVIRFDYNVSTGVASNPVVVATAAQGLAFPNAIKFSPDGSKYYVSNLGGTGVAQFNAATDTLAGAPVNGAIAGGSIFQFSGLEWSPSGQLLVGGFQDFPAATSGAVARSNPAVSALADFIGPSTSLNGASGLLVDGDKLYVTSMFAGTIQRFDVNTGVLDPTFGVSGLAFPQQMIRSPDGNGFLVGILGIGDGEGFIAHYDFNGNLIGDGVFVGGANGFQEATAMALVPEPSSLVLMAIGLLSVGFTAWRRRARQV